MRWPVLAVSAYLVLAAQFGMARVFETDHGYVEPRLVLLLAVYIGLWAQPNAVMIVWGILGLGMDLITTWQAQSVAAEGPIQFALIGPYTLGFLGGAYVLLSCRGVLLSRHPLAMGSMVFISGLAVQLIVVGVMSLRMWYDQPAPVFTPTSELMIRSAAVITTAIIGVIVAMPMNAMSPLFGFEGTRGRRGRARIPADGG
jgi:hypothetical protein